MDKTFHEEPSSWQSSTKYGRLLMVGVLCLTIIAIITSTTESTKMEPKYDISGGVNKIRAPVIGILTQVLRDYMRFTDKKHLHIASSYVKWIEGAGAQVLPILLNQNESYYENVFEQTNGLLLPGGDNLLNPKKDTPMMVAAKILYKLAIKANDHGDHYPIWGTCLGLELLSVLSANRNVLEQCSANDLALTMSFKERGRLFAPSGYAGLTTGQDFSKSIIEALGSKNLTYNYHHKCLTDDGLKKAGLTDFYRPLAYSRDLEGKKFIAIFEAIDYPIYGVQFHPEKPAYEFVVKRGQRRIPHSREAIAVSRYFADFFVNSASMNRHKSDTIDLDEALIYAHDPMYTALKHDMYEQRYLFPYQDNGLSTEEFLEYIPDDDDEAPEDVPPDVVRDEDATVEKMINVTPNGHTDNHVVVNLKDSQGDQVDLLLSY